MSNLTNKATFYTYETVPSLDKIIKDFDSRFPLEQSPFERPKLPIVTMFLQTFPDTAGLLSQPGYLSGQMFTDFYITVIKRDDVFGVYQSNSFVFALTNPSVDFFDDLSKQNLATLSKAKSKYTFLEISKWYINQEGE